MYVIILFYWNQSTITATAFLGIVILCSLLLSGTGYKSRNKRAYKKGSTKGLSTPKQKSAKVPRESIVQRIIAEAKRANAYPKKSNRGTPRIKWNCKPHRLPLTKYMRQCNSEIAKMLRYVKAEQELEKIRKESARYDADILRQVQTGVKGF